MKGLKNNFKQKRGFKYLVFTLIILISATITNAIIYAAEGDLKSIVKEGDALIEKRNIDSYEKALIKYQKALSQEPDNTDFMIKTANALNHIMRVKTNGNTVKIDGTTQDDEKNKQIWAKYGSEAVKLAEAAVKKRPNDKEALCVYAESYMYYSSSFGILKAIFQGAAGQYKENAQALIDNFPKLDDGVGYIYLCAFYMVAPWPMSDLSKAKKNSNKVLELCPDSLRAHYYAAIVAIKDKDYESANKELNYVLNNECTMTSEHDYCAFLKDQAKKGLTIIEGKIKK